MLLWLPVSPTHIMMISTQHHRILIPYMVTSNWYPNQLWPIIITDLTLKPNKNLENMCLHNTNINGDIMKDNLSSCDIMLKLHIDLKSINWAT